MNIHENEYFIMRDDKGISEYIFKYFSNKDLMPKKQDDLIKRIKNDIKAIMSGQYENTLLHKHIQNDTNLFSNNELLSYLSDNKNIMFLAEKSKLTKDYLFFENDNYKYYLKTKKDIYLIDKYLASGGNSLVYVVENIKNEKYALKFFSGKSMRSSGFINEVKHLSKFNQKNILKCIDSLIDDPKYMFMITKLYNYSLDKFLLEKYEEKNRFNNLYNITLENYFSMAFALLDSLIYCEKEGFYHNDIKEDNIFFDDFNNIVLGDFGTIGYKNRENEKEPVRNGRTPSPEQLIDDRSDMSKSDVYSIGLILNKLLTKTYPVGNNYTEVSKKYPDIVFIDYIISRMLEQRKEHRLSLQSAKNYFKFFYDLKNLDNLINYKDIVPHHNEYIENVKLDLSTYNEFYDNNIKHYNFKVSYHLHKIVNNYISLYVKDITLYNENQKKLLDEEVIFDTSCSENLVNVVFYDVGKFLMINLRYKNGYSKILFKYKCFIKEYLNLFDVTIRDYSIYIDDRSEIKFKNNNQDFHIFEMNHKEFSDNKIKFIFFDNSFERSNLYFILDNFLYPIPITQKIYDKIKNILKQNDSI